MIDGFLSGDSRSRLAAIFCVALVACQPPSRPSSNGIAQPDPEATAPSRQDAAPTSANEATSPPTDTQRNPTATKDDARPPLRSETKPRSRALLVSELQLMSQLLEQTPKSAPDRPQLLRRIAEDFAQLEQVAKK